MSSVARILGALQPVERNFKAFLGSKLVVVQSSDEREEKVGQEVILTLVSRDCDRC